MAAFFTAYIFGILRIDIINVIGWISPGFIHDKYLMYRASQEMQAGGYQVNIFSLLFMARAALWCILLWKSDLLFKNNKYALILLKIMALSLISMLVFSTNIAFALRTMEFYGIVEILLFPMLIYLFRQKIVPRIALVCFATIAIYSRIFIFELILN